MKRDDGVTSITKRLKKTGDISQRDADYMYSYFREGYTNDAFIKAACRTLSKAGNYISAFPLDVRFSQFLELLPWNLRSAKIAVEGNTYTFDRVGGQIKVIRNPSDYEIFIEEYAEKSWRFREHIGRRNSLLLPCRNFTDLLTRALLGVALETITPVFSKEYDGTCRIYAKKGSCSEMLDLFAKEDEIWKGMSEILPKKIVRAFQANKPIYFVHESLVKSVMKYIRSFME